MRKRTSKIWECPKEQLQALLDTSDSLVEVIGELGLDPYAGNHKTLHSRIREDNLSVEKLERNRSVARRQHLVELNSRKYSDEEVFVENSHYHRKHIKRRVLEGGLLPEICDQCGVGAVWYGKPLTLQLDHINGVSNDHRLSNLRFLCPNCHSQTETFGSKNRPTKNKSKSRSMKERRVRRKFDPSKDELSQMVNSMPMTQVGKHYGVSDNAVRKRCKLLGISW